MKKTVVIDIDDTLGDMRNPMSDMLNRYSNKNLHWNSWNEFRTEHLYGIGYDEFLVLLRDNNIIENMKPHDESVQFMHTLADMDYRTVLLSARNWHDNAADITKDWLELHNIPYDELIICNIGDNKSDIISNICNDIKFVVDDSIAHCMEYAENKNIEKVFVYDMPWNRAGNIDEKRINRIYNLNQIMENL